METGMRIREYLDQHGITQVFLSSRTVIPTSKLNLSLNGKRRMTFDEYERICWALNVAPETFIEPHAPNEQKQDAS